MSVSDHERRNREFWDADADDYQAAHATALDRGAEAWGVWRIPESELGVLGDVAGSTCSSSAAAPRSGRSRSRRTARVSVGLDQSRGAAPPRRAAQSRRRRRRGARVRERRSGPVRRRVVRRRVLRPRRDVVLRSRPSPCPRWRGSCAPAGGSCSAHTTPLALPHLDADRDRQSRRLRRPYFGMRRSTTSARARSTSSSRTASGSACSAGTASCRRPHRAGAAEAAPPRPTPTSYRRWARRWPAEQIWVTRKP